MDIKTHDKIDQRLCGRPVAVEDRTSRIEFTATDDMAVDETGLVHGGFVFGLADHAAMLAVNHPNVVLGGADVNFLKPVRVGEPLWAEAKVMESVKKRHTVDVTVACKKMPVFTGRFVCFVLDRHVLKRN